MTRELKFDRVRFNAGEMPVRTRNGTKVLWVADTGLGGPYPLIAIIEGCEEAPRRYTADGRYDHTAPSVREPLDLVHEPRTVKVTVVVYRSSISNRIYTTTDAIAIDSIRRSGAPLAEHTFEIEE